MTSKNVHKEFLRWYSTGNPSPFTVKNYRAYLQKFEDFVKNKRYSYVTIEDIQKYHEFLASRKLKPKTIFIHLVPVRLAIDYALMRGWTKLSPNAVRLPKGRSQNWTPATKEHLVRMLRVIGGRPFLALRNELIIKFLFDSGVRVGELCNELIIDSINLTEKRCVIKTEKNNDPRVIFWGDVTNEVMSRYLDMRLEFAACNNIFITERGTKMTTRQVERVVASLRKKAGIQEHIVPHSYRGGFATDGAKKSIYMETLRRFMGHRSIISTQPYLHLDDPTLKEAYDKIYAQRLSD